MTELDQLAIYVGILYCVLACFLALHGKYKASLISLALTFPPIISLVLK